MKFATIHPSWEGNTEICRYMAIVNLHPGDYYFFNKRTSEDLTYALKKFDFESAIVYEQVNGRAWQKILETIRKLNSGDLNPDRVKLEDLLINPAPLEDSIPK